MVQPSGVVPTLGVFGGAFDPPHLGHVLVPTYLRALGLVDRVVVAPVADHPLGKVLHPFADRLLWTRAAMAVHGDEVEVSDLEQALAADGGPSYTLRLLEAVAARHPTHRVRLVIGADIVRTGQTASWHRWADIESRFEPIVVPRSEPGRPGPLPEISSSDVRQWLAEDSAEARGRLAQVLPAQVRAMVVPMERPSVWILGRGHLATHGALYLQRRGYAPKLLPGRGTARGEVAWPDEDPAAVWIAVRDPEISRVAAALVGRVGPSTVVLHGSGRLRSEDVLGELLAAGVPSGTLHPAASLRAAWPDPRILDRAAFGVEGSPAAVAWARSLVGGHAVIDLQGLSAAQRLRYHAGCALVANHLAVSDEAVREVWRELGVDAAVQSTALESLWTSALANLTRLGTPAGVSGPAARGDKAGVQAHREALGGAAGELYGVLSEALLRLMSPHLAR